MEKKKLGNHLTSNFGGIRVQDYTSRLISEDEKCGNRDPLDHESAAIRRLFESNPAKQLHFLLRTLDGDPGDDGVGVYNISLGGRIAPAPLDNLGQLG